MIDLYDLKDKRVLVTGSSGSIGSALIKYLVDLDYGPSHVIGIDQNESGIFFQDQLYAKDDRVISLTCDVSNYNALSEVMEDVNVVFHLAAQKHVVVNERSPAEALRSNVVGVENIIRSAKTHAVERVVFSSSDKAVSPTNVMGATKLLGERLFAAANYRGIHSRTKFITTRFGNVLGSDGSVLPIFYSQVDEGKNLTVTDRGMTRFVMTREQAISLLVRSLVLGRGGDLFVIKMPVLRIWDLAEAVISNAEDCGLISKGALKVVEIGPKQGEKMFEELMSPEEIRRARELEDFFVISHPFSPSNGYDYPGLVNRVVNSAYSSELEPVMPVSEIKNYLLENFQSGAFYD